MPSEPREDPIGGGGVRSAPFSTAVSLASGKPLAGEGAELPDEPHPPPRLPGEGAARVLEILSQRARRCSRSRSSLRGLTQRSRPVSSLSLIHI